MNYSDGRWSRVGLSGATRLNLTFFLETVNDAMTDWKEESAYALDCTMFGCAKIHLDPKLKFFDPCFRYNIGMTDIEGMVERNGHFLFIEWKRPDIEVDNKSGQIRSFRALTKVSRNITGLVIWGDPETMEPVKIAWIKNGDWWPAAESAKAACRPCSQSHLLKIVTNWFEMADRGSRE